MLIVCVVFVGQCMTMPEYVKLRYGGQRICTFLAALKVFGAIAVEISVSSFNYQRYDLLSESLRDTGIDIFWHSVTNVINMKIPLMPYLSANIFVRVLLIKEPEPLLNFTSLNMFKLHL